MDEVSVAIIGHLNKGNQLISQKRFSEGEGHVRLALEICQQVDWESKTLKDADEIYLALGATLHSCSNYVEAEGCMRKALDMKIKLNGDGTNNADIAESYHSLGRTLQAIGRYSEAEDCKRKVSKYAPKSSGIPESYHSLGNALHLPCGYTEAEECANKALKRKMMSYHYDETSRSLDEAIQDLGKTQEAQVCELKDSDLEETKAKKEHDDDADFSDGDEILSTDDIGQRYIEICIRSCDEKMMSLYGSKKVYPMSKVIRGRCLIINNKTFLDGNKFHAERTGSDIDVANLTNLFANLRFIVTVKHDVEGYKLTEVVKNEVSLQDHQVCGMFVLVIMTHGDCGVLYGSDSVPVKRHDVLQELYDSESLKGKPKLVIIQACAGDRRTRYEYDAMPSSLSQQTSAPPNDVVLLTSAFDGFLSKRHVALGSPFIRALTEAIYKHAHHWHIEKIYKQVAHKLNLTGHPPAAMNSFLSKKLYLFPNYDGE